jgi:transcription termination/antitermination protein NusG
LGRWRSCKRTTEDRRLRTERDTFETGALVRVWDGPFTSFIGTVEEVDDVRLRLKVAVSIYGRTAPAELEFGQVEKL